MKVTKILAPSLALFVLGFHGFALAADKSDLVPLQGTWTMESFILNGETIPEEQTKTGRLVISGTEYRAQFGDSAASATLGVDSSKNPRAIDFTFNTGPLKGKTIEGIYRLEGDKLTICRALLEGEERPKEFASPAESGVLVVIWKRSHSKPSPREMLVEQELTRLRGRWLLVSSETDGKAMPEEQARKFQVTIAGTTHTVRFGDKVVTENVLFEIDPTVSPKRTTDTLDDGPYRGKKIRGIYKVEGDTLTSCVSPLEKEAPPEFSAKAGTGRTLRVFKRLSDPSESKQATIELERKKFEGTWSLASIVSQGDPVPASSFRGDRLILKGERFVSRSGGEVVEGTFSIDPTMVPKTIDVTVTGKDGGTKKYVGIYTLDDETYTVCIGMEGKPRPTVFESKAGDGAIFEVLKREKP